MFYPEADAALLKAWIVKRLEGHSDADPDILADYLLALLQHDGDEQSVRELCLAEIPDFLQSKEGAPPDTRAFVDDIIDCVRLKAYKPGADLNKLRAVRASVWNSASSLVWNPNPPSVSVPAPTVAPIPAPATAPVPGVASYLAVPPSGVKDDTLSIGKKRQRHDKSGSAGSEQLPRPTKLSRRSKVHATQQSARCRAWDSGYCPRGTTCKYLHVYEPIMPGAFSTAQTAEYDPTQPGFDISALAASEQLVELLSKTPGFAAGAFLPADPGGNAPPARAKPRKAPFSADGVVHDPNAKTIVVENIPDENFTETHVQDFFSQFGKITNVTLMQVPQKAALVTYDLYISALAAYKSPKVIFDNRFVKVFWYKGSMGANSKHTSVHTSHPPAIGQVSNEIDLEEFIRKQADAQRAHDERMRQKQELEKEKQLLASRQQQIHDQKRKLLAVLAAKGANITSRTENYDRDSQPDNGGNNVEDVDVDDDDDDDDDDDQEITITTEDHDHSNMSGGLTQDFLQAKLADMEAEARKYGIDPDDDTESVMGWPPSRRGGSHHGGFYVGGYRGRGGFRGRYGFRGVGFRGGFRGGYRGGLMSVGSVHEAYARYSLDNRPKAVVLSGVNFAAPTLYEALRHHLLGIGDFTQITVLPEKTTIVFKDRKTAEACFASVKDGLIPGVDEKVEVAWDSASLSATSAPANGNGVSQTEPSPLSTFAYEIEEL